MLSNKLSLFRSFSSFNKNGLGKTLHSYFIDFPSSSQLLNEFSLNKKQSKLNVQNVLKEMNVNSNLQLTAPHLLNMPIKHHHENLKDLNLIFPDKLNKISHKLTDYSTMLLNVMGNKFSQRDYELDLSEKENISERRHADQATKIGLQLGLSDDLLLALFFHDVGRVTHSSVSYGHKHHAYEGSLILKPLSLFNYTGYHAFAKFLLNKFCASYEELISPLSKKSLAIQEVDFSQIKIMLAKVEPELLLRFCYKIMILRLIDDLSKIPDELLNSMTPDERYLTHDEIKSLIIKKLTTECQCLVNTKSEDYQLYENDLDVALSLLHRADQYLQSENIATKSQSLSNK
jgi:predicted HD phosphohydrolase